MNKEDKEVFLILQGWRKVDPGGKITVNGTLLTYPFAERQEQQLFYWPARFGLLIYTLDEAYEKTFE